MTTLDIYFIYSYKVAKVDQLETAIGKSMREKVNKDVSMNVWVRVIDFANIGRIDG
jgi:hypothetical protein